MEKSLEKARSIFPKCATVATKLRAMAFNKEEQLEAQNDQVKFLIQLSTRTLPRGLHCLSLQLTSKYFELPRAERDPDSKKRLEQPNLYHYAIFSNNVLACAVVVNSTISSSLVILFYTNTGKYALYGKLYYLKGAIYFFMCRIQRKLYFTL